MLASVRLAQIVSQFGPVVKRLLIREMDGETLSITLYFEDGTKEPASERCLEDVMNVIISNLP